MTWQPGWRGMDRLLASIAIAAALLAGCAAPVAPIEAPAQQTGATADPAAAAPALVPEARSTVSSVMFREHVDAALADVEFTESREVLPDREVAVHYAGIHEVLDEFGRAVPAYVFRYDDQVFVMDSFDHRSGPRGHFEPHETEFAFDLADGRFLGPTDLKEGTRAFAPPGMRMPIAGGAFAFMYFHVHPDPTAEVLLWEGEQQRVLLRYEPVDDHPLPGDCQSYQAKLRVEPEVDGPTPRPAGDKERARSLVCIEAGGAPLWTWHGTSRAFASTQRLGAPFSLPPLSGAALEPVTYAKEAWEPVGGLAGVADATLSPPSGGADWAAAVALRAEAAYLDPGYAAYRTQAGKVAVSTAYMDMPGQTTIVINDMELPTLPVGVGHDSLLEVTDGERTRLEMFMRTRGAPTDGQLVPMPSSVDYSDGHRSDAASDLPTARAVQDQLAALLPAGEGATIFHHLAFEEAGMEHEMAYWVHYSACGDQGGALAFIDAQGGHAVFAASFRPDSEYCKAMKAGRLSLQAPSALAWVEEHVA